MPILENRYAEALINIAAEKNELDVYQQDLGVISGAFTGLPEFKSFLLNPETEVGEKKTALQRMFQSNIRDEVLNLILLLIDKGRVKYLPGIYVEFVRLADDRRSVLSMKIVSAAPLEQAQLEAIREKFRKLYNASSVKADVEIDESLIGGVKVMIGDKLIDGSVKGMLKNLQDALIK